MLRMLISFTFVFLCSSCFSINIPLYAPPKTYEQESKIKVVDREEHDIPSAIPAIIAFTLTGITVGNFYVESAASLSGRRVNRFKASLAGAVIGAPIGAAVGHTIKKQARFKSLLKPKPKNQIKRTNYQTKNHGSIIKLFPTLFFGTIGYMAGNHRPFYSDLKPTESTSSKSGAVLGSVAGGTLGYWIGNRLSNRPGKQETVKSDS